MEPSSLNGRLSKTDDAQRLYNSTKKVVCDNRTFALYNFSTCQPRKNRFATLFLAIFWLLERIKWISKNNLYLEIKDEAKPLFGRREGGLNKLSILPKNVNGHNLLPIRWYSISPTYYRTSNKSLISPRQDVNRAIGQRILPTPFHIGSQRYVESFETLVQDSQSKNCHK